MIAWALSVLLESGCRPVIGVVPQEHLDLASSALGESDDVALVAGGATRRQSVDKGLELVETDRVLLHDAARPFVTVDAVGRVIDALHDVDGVVTAVVLDETVKRVRDWIMMETIDRTKLYRVQTPQAFHTQVLRRAHQRAHSEGFEGTDDAELVERYGGRIAVVAGSRANIKLTFAEDFRVAESMLGIR